jgi:hypothetical protein
VYARLLGVAIPVCLLFSGSTILPSGEKTTGSFLQFLGTGRLMVILLIHIAETFHLVPGMQWGPSMARVITSIS